MAVNEYLLRVWGRDADAVAQLRTPDLKEEDGALNYWFPTASARKDFDKSLQSHWVVRASTDPGFDLHGETIYPRCLTVALVTLRFSDGAAVSFEMPFGYGYSEHGVRYMFEEGNYSCDCNRQLFAERYCGRTPLADDDVLCGDTIELVSLVVEKRPMLVTH